ncbi:MAG: hypothetical protein C5B52_01805, partial [Bacteroidetes bacterium]
MKKSSFLRYGFFFVSFFQLQYSIAQTNIANLQNADTQLADSFYSLGQWKAAIPAYEVALKKDVSNSLAWNRLGYSYHNTGEYAKAISAYQKSLGNQPFPQLKTVVQSRMSRSYALMQKKNESLIWLDSATKNGYANLKEMDSLRDYDFIRNESDFKAFYNRAYNIAYPCMSDPRARQF